LAMHGEKARKFLELRHRELFNGGRTKKRRQEAGAGNQKRKSLSRIQINAKRVNTLPPNCPSETGSGSFQSHPRETGNGESMIPRTKREKGVEGPSLIGQKETIEKPHQSFSKQNILKERRNLLLYGGFKNKTNPKESLPCRQGKHALGKERERKVLGKLWTRIGKEGSDPDQYKNQPEKFLERTLLVR